MLGFGNFISYRSEADSNDVLVFANMVFFREKMKAIFHKCSSLVELDLCNRVVGILRDCLNYRKNKKKL